MKDIKKKSITWWIGALACAVLFGSIGVFAYAKTQSLLDGVRLVATISHPDSNSPLVEVRGKAPNAVHVTLDGREIFITQDGTFDEKVALLPGLGVVTIDAKSKFGETTSKKFALMYTENNGTFAYNETPISNH
jgi:hypothetical protein